MAGRNKRLPLADRREVLQKIARLVHTGQWVTLDTETTGLSGQVIEVAICEPNLVTHTWRIRPTIPIEPEATQIHGLHDEDVADCPTYAQIWPEIEATINGRKNVMYNASFDYHRLFASARAHQMKGPRIWQNQCAMTWYAIYHGEPMGTDGYCYQSLEVACQQMGIPVEEPLHRAATDARLTAKLMLKLAEIADQELPSSWLVDTD